MAWSGEIGKDGRATGSVQELSNPGIAGTCQGGSRLGSTIGSTELWRFNAATGEMGGLSWCEDDSVLPNDCFDSKG